MTKFIVHINLKILIIIFLYILYDYLYQKKRYNNELNKKEKKKDLDYNNINFVILRRRCSSCGLFSDYIVYLGCINDFISKGFVPIVDVKSYRNFYNGFKLNSSNINAWELFFEQPFGYKLNDVLVKAKKIKYFSCIPNNRPSSNIFFNKILNDYWHNTQKQYSSLNNKLLRQ